MPRFRHHVTREIREASAAREAAQYSQDPLWQLLDEDDTAEPAAQPAVDDQPAKGKK